MTKPIKTALASFGMSGKVFHAPLLLNNPGYELTHIVQRSSNSAKEFVPKAKIVSSFEAMLAEDDIELVIVNTPDMLHFEQTRLALESGKHVVTEKPFVQTVAEGERLLQLAADNGVVLSVFQNRRWDNSFMTVRKVIQEGLLGRLVEFEARYDRYRTWVADSWKEQSGLGVGILQNLGSHLIDQALVLFGMPSGVFCKLDAMRDNSQVSDYFDVKLIYPNLSVTLKASYLVRQPGPAYVLHGVNGTFVKHGLDPQEDALNRGLSPGTEGWGSDPEAFYGTINTDISGLHYLGKIETVPGDYQAYYHSLHHAIRFGMPVPVHASEALNVIRIIEAAVRSNECKKIVEL